jgi:hypothetical protein
MVLQPVGGEVMLREHPLNPTVIDRLVIACPDNPRQLARSKGRGER